MIIKKIYPMEFQFQVLDPFIVAFHYYDKFPKGNGKMGPQSMPKGKNNGADFDPNASWRMYQSDRVISTTKERVNL